MPRFADAVHWLYNTDVRTRLDMAEMQPMPREWPNTQTQRAAWERMQRDDQFLRSRQAAGGGRAHLYNRSLQSST